MDGGAWWAAVHGFAEGRTWLSDFTFTFHFHALKEMAAHSSVLAWRIPGTGEPGGLPSMGSHRVRHDWSDLAAAGAQKIKNLPTTQETAVWCLGWEDPRRRKWQPTPVFLPGESHGQRSLVDYIQSMGSQRVGHDWVTNTLSIPEYAD